MLPRRVPVIIPYAQHIGKHQHGQHDATGLLPSKDQRQQWNREHTRAVYARLRHTREYAYRQEQQQLRIGKVK